MDSWQRAGPSAESEPAIEVTFRPQGRHPGLPVEAFDRSELVERIPGPHRGRRQRADFHLLFLCIDGESSHIVDFAEYPLTPGTVLRIRPGQTHQYVDLSELSMFTVIWRAEHHVEEAGRPPWFPGGPDPTRFVLAHDLVGRATTWVGELRIEQDRFDGSSRRLDLMSTILRGLLLIVEEGSGEHADATALPVAYVELRELLEADLHERPSVQRLAHELGYSSRTLDRACQAVSGQTAREVVDERIRLELRRLLADDTIPIGQVRRTFGFDEASNFTKYVRRIVGQTPIEFRQKLVR